MGIFLLISDNADVKTETEKLSAQSDLESVVTAYCALHKLDYNPTSGWLDILKTLIHFQLPTPLLYEFFCAILKKFVPKDGAKNEVIHHLFRLIILYHDPELCNFIDSKRVTFDKFSSTWVRLTSFFSAIPNFFKFLQISSNFILFLWNGRKNRKKSMKNLSQVDKSMHE